MRIRIVPIASVLAFSLTLVTGAGISCHLSSVKAAVRPQQSDDTQMPQNVRPEVGTLIKQATAAYQGMKSYRHVAECIEKGRDLNGGEVNLTTSYVLALERPNKFCYRSEEPKGSAAVSDGKTFINYRNDDTEATNGRTYFTRMPAPATYKNINIVDDITFRLGSYLVALMLQGNVYADKEISTSLSKATLKAGVTDNGKKYDVIATTYQDGDVQCDVQFLFDATTHLLRKTYSVDSQRTPARRSEIQVTEILEEVQIDKPIPASVFQYSPPKGAHLIVQAPTKRQRPYSALVLVRR